MVFTDTLSTYLYRRTRCSPAACAVSRGMLFGPTSASPQAPAPRSTSPGVPTEPWAPELVAHGAVPVYGLRLRCSLHLTTGTGTVGDDCLGARGGWPVPLELCHLILARVAHRCMSAGGGCGPSSSGQGVQSKLLRQEISHFLASRPDGDNGVLVRHSYVRDCVLPDVLPPVRGCKTNAGGKGRHFSCRVVA